MVRTLYIFSTIIFLLLATSVYADTNQINGKITDSDTNYPLENVNISISKTNLGASSDKYGYYILSDLPSGKYNLVVSRIGYVNETIIVTLNGNESVMQNFNLIPTVLKLQPIDVTGNHYHDQIANPMIESLSLKSTITTINHREIKKQGAKNLIDAMKYIPGGLTETRGRIVKQFFSVRGQKYPYPDYAINGIVQKEFHETTYFFSASDIEQIDIIRSSSALLKGFSPMAGIINIKTKEYMKSTTNATLEYGTFNSLKTSVSHGNKIGNISFTTGLGYMATEGPKNMYAEEKNSNFYQNIKYQSSENFYIQSNIFYLKGKRQLAIAIAPASMKYQNFKQTYDPIQTLLTNIKIFHKQSNKSSSELHLYFSDRKPVMKMRKTPDTEMIQYSEADYEYGANFIQSISIIKNNNLRIGAFYNYWNAPEGKRFYIGKKCELSTYSFVIVDEHNFGKWNIDAGVRLNKTYYHQYGGFNINGSGKGLSNVDPIKNEWDEPVIQTNLGTSYQWNNSTSININVTKGLVTPRTGTLTSNSIKPKKEDVTKLDIGLNKIIPSLGIFTLTGFYTNQNNAIVLSGTTFTDTLSGRILELYTNRDQNSKGIEFEFRFTKLFRHFEPFFNATFMRSHMKSQDKMEKNEEFPEILINSGLYATYNNFDLNLFVKYVSSYENDRFSSSGPQPLGDFITFDITTGYTIQKLSNLRIYTEIQNLTGKKYSTVVGYPDFGRQIRFGIRIGL